MKIKKIHYNWHMCGDPTDSWGEDFDVVEVGKRDVVEIQEHLPTFEGEKHYVDIILSNGERRRVFNLNEIFYDKE